MLERIQIDLSDLPDLHRKYACQFASVTMIGSDRSRLVHAIAGGVDHHVEHFSTERGPMSCAERVIFSQKLLRIDDTAFLAPNETCPLMVAEDLRAYIGAPIIVDAKTVGVVEMMNATPRVWTEVEIAAIERLAAHCAQELERQQNHDETVVVPFAARPR